MNSPEHAVLSAIGVCLLGAGLTLLTARQRRLTGVLACLATMLSAGLVGWAIWRVLTVGSTPGVTFLERPELGFALRLSVDGLSAVFLALAAAIAVPAVLYSVPYLEHYRDYSVGRYYPHFLLFLAAMYGLLSTTDMMWFFFIFWQLMTLPGYALIRFEHRRPENRRAANKYLLMMQIACAATMLGAEILTLGAAGASGQGGLKYDFGAVSQAMPVLLVERPGLTAFAVALFVLGFGIKMGMWPMGAVWLPDAHPAAPSPVSALLSGVMIKTGVYGLIRYLIWLVPLEGRSSYPLAVWGGVVATLGTLTLLAGTAQALRQEQTKRLLAFHSIGQVGYILLGLGVSLSLLSAGRDAWPLAAVALFAALFHTVNHGLFKALLFLNAGSVLYRTDTQNLNRLGGLLRFMPLTGLTALIASLAISGVPPLNGFASKWTLYVAAVEGAAWCPLLSVCALVAIFTSALTLASFVKFFGAAFLTRPSQLVLEKSRPAASLEVPRAMQIPQVALAAACVFLGLFPGLAAVVVGRALQASREGLGVALASAFPGVTAAGGGWPAAAGETALRPLVIVAVLVVALGITWAFSRVGGTARRRAAPWLCGYARESEAHRYTAHGFYGEVKRYLRLP